MSDCTHITPTPRNPPPLQYYTLVLEDGSHVAGWFPDYDTARLVLERAAGE